MPELEIYFNEDLHKYSDNFTNAYTSVTTVIGNYEHKFSDKEVDIAKACERIGRNPAHPKYNKYRGKSADMILAEWERTRVEACSIGNTKHNYLETSVKSATGFSNLFKPKSGRLFTIKDIADNNLGELNLTYFIETGIDKLYPEIYDIVVNFINNGWKIYAEICTYNYDKLVAGLIDILFIKDTKFVILDWKTNKNKLRFESGYYDKDDYGNTTNFITTDEVLKSPLSHLPQSNGNKYTLQLSTYAYLTEQFGYTNAGLILCHISHDYYTLDEATNKNNSKLNGLNKVEFYTINYLKKDVKTMLNHFVINNSREKSQYLMFNKN